MKRIQNLRARRDLSRYLLLSILSLVVLLGGQSGAFARASIENEKIAYMLDAIGSSNLTFVRNGTEYLGQDAKDHLQKKLDLAGDQIKSAEDFISYVASRSSLTGTPYYVRYPDGHQVESGIWLRQILAGMVIPKRQSEKH